MRTEYQVPDEFTDQELEQIVEWLDEQEVVCDCGGSEWAVGTHRTGLVLPQSIAGLRNVSFIPVVTVTCIDCAQIRLYSPVLMLEGSGDE